MDENWHAPLKTVINNRWTTADQQMFEDSIKKIVSDKWSVEPKQVDLIKNFKPASKEQIKEWLSWIESANKNIENIKKHEKVKQEEEKLKEEKSLKSFNHIIFNPYKVEYTKESFFSKDKKNFQNSDYYNAYEYFGKQQLKLYKKFDSEKTLENYKKLIKHIHSHGKYIDKIPEEPEEIIEEEVEQVNVKQTRRNIHITNKDDSVSAILEQETIIYYDEDDT